MARRLERRHKEPQKRDSVYKRVCEHGFQPGCSERPLVRSSIVRVFGEETQKPRCDGACLPSFEGTWYLPYLGDRSRRMKSSRLAWVTCPCLKNHGRKKMKEKERKEVGRGRGERERLGGTLL